MVKSWRLLAALTLAALPALAQPYKIAVIGLIHSHEGTYVPRMTRSEQVKLVGIAESIPDLVNLAKERQGAKDVPFFDDYKKMLDETKPDFVWAFVENNRHLEILKECAPRHIHVIYEKPLASTYKDAVAMAELAKKYNVKVMCNYQMAWWPANQIARVGGRKGRHREDLAAARHRRARRPRLHRHGKVLLRLAHRPGEERRRRAGGFRLLQRALVPLVYGASGKRLRRSDPPASGDIPESGGLGLAGAEVQERHQRLRRKLGPAAQFPGSGDLRFHHRARTAASTAAASI